MTEFYILPRNYIYAERKRVVPATIQACAQCGLATTRSGGLCHSCTNPTPVTS